MDKQNSLIMAFGTFEQKSDVFFKTIESLDHLSDEERFLCIMDLRVFFFNDATKKQKIDFISAVLKYIRLDVTYIPHYTELLGIIYKYVPQPQQKQIVKKVLSLTSSLSESTRGIVSWLNFYKNAHRSFTKETQKCFKHQMELLRDNAVPALQETFSYVEHNISRFFKGNKNAPILIVIPEMLSGSSFLQMPIALMTAISAARERGIDCDLLDNRVFGYGCDQVAEIAQNYLYVTVCSSTIDQVQNYFLDYRYDIFKYTVNAIRNCGAKIIVCGAHGTVRPELVMRDVQCDYLLCGEFDFQLVDLFDTLINKRDINIIPNLYIKTANGVSYTYTDDNVRHPVKWITSRVPYEDINVSDYFGYAFYNNVHTKKMNWGILQASRGCPFNCSFCFDFYRKRIRYKHIDNIISEIKILEGKGVSNVFFIDQTFTANRDYVIDLCEAMIKNDLKLTWQCETRVDLIDAEVLSVMKKAGCVQIWLGIESLDENVLNKNNKNYGIDVLENALKLLETSGIAYCAFVMLGMVGDTSESMRKTIDEIIRRKIRITRSVITFAPRFGTDVLIQYPELSNADFHALDYLKGKVGNSLDSDDLACGLSRLLAYMS